MSDPTESKPESTSESTPPPSNPILGGIKYVFKSMLSPDRPTRRMGVLFIVSLLGASSMVGWWFYRVKHPSVSGTVVIGAHPTEAKTGPPAHGAPDPHAAPDPHDPQSAGKKSTGTEVPHVSLGRFTMELKLPPDQPPVKGLLNLAEVEIQVNCDTEATCKLIEERLVYVRNEVTVTFAPIDKEDLMNRDGKQRLLRDIVIRLNKWLPSGKVHDAYISQLVIN